jgi:hypothetical protein
MSHNVQLNSDQIVKVEERTLKAYTKWTSDVDQFIILTTLKMRSNIFDAGLQLLRWDRLSMMLAPIRKRIHLVARIKGTTAL